MCENVANMSRQNASRRIVRTFWNVEIKEKAERGREGNNEDNPGAHAEQREREEGRTEGSSLNLQQKSPRNDGEEEEESRQP